MPWETSSRTDWERYGGDTSEMDEEEEEWDRKGQSEERWERGAPDGEDDPDDDDAAMAIQAWEEQKGRRKDHPDMREGKNPSTNTTEMDGVLRGSDASTIPPAAASRREKREAVPPALSAVERCCRYCSYLTV